jgi:hypothetical protein
MAWLEKQFNDKFDKYIFVDCHNDSPMHNSFKFSTHIFPKQDTDDEGNGVGPITPATPIFFNFE